MLAIHVKMIRIHTYIHTYIYIHIYIYIDGNGSPGLPLVWEAPVRYIYARSIWFWFWLERIAA
jgi:hypothetical protein